METFESEIFRMPANVYVRHRTRRAVIRSVFIIALILAVAGVLSVDDHRFIYLGLIFLFVVYPMTMSMVWLRAAASPELQLFIRPQRWIADTTGITICYYPYPKPDEDPDSTPETPTASCSIRYSDIESIEDNGGKYIFINYRNAEAKHHTTVAAPVAALPPDTWKYIRTQTDDNSHTENLA